MEPIKLYEIVEAVSGSFGYNADIDVMNVSTDTRTIKEGSVFVCIKGERFDGHDFAQKAVENGAVAVVSERPIPNVKCIIVDSSFKALGSIAKYYRSKFKDLKLIAVTGSVGKTSTKEMIYLVMSKKFRTLKTQGNLNNEIGLPATLFNLTSDTQAAVIEMGMNHLGEISRLSTIANPQTCVITNIGTAHIGNLGSQENILKAKMEIFDGAEYGAPLVTNLDDKLLSQVELRCGEKLTYSLSKKTAGVYASDIKRDENGADFVINYAGNKYNARINTPGDHNILNALCAFTVGVRYEIDPCDIVKAIAEFQTDGMRQNKIEVNGVAYMLDCYNASPEAMRSSLSVFKDAKTNGRKIAVLADMLELGEGSRNYHKSVGEFFSKTEADLLVCYGNDASAYAQGAVKKGYDESKTACFTDADELISYLKKEISQGDLVLFKGSHGMKLDSIFKKLTDNQ